jgi:cell division transport system ATP-binding protein
MIIISNVSKDYSGGNITAIHNINFEIQEGEFVFLIGPSGSGKTTIIKMLIREETPSNGKIFFDNEEVTRYSRNQIYNLRRKIGVIFQDYKLIEDQNAFENVAFVMEAAGKSNKEIHDTVPYLLDIVGLADRMGAFPRELSGGEKQRVAIARALANNPKLLIADEPTGNLDPESAWDIVRILKKINEWGTTVFMSTHGLDIVEELGQRILKVQNGQLSEETNVAGYKTERQRLREEFEQKVSGGADILSERLVIKTNPVSEESVPDKDSETQQSIESKEESTEAIATEENLPEVEPAENEEIKEGETEPEVEAEESIKEESSEPLTEENQLESDQIEPESTEESTPEVLPEEPIKKSIMKLMEEHKAKSTKTESDSNSSELKPKEKEEVDIKPEKPKKRLKISLVDKRKKAKKTKTKESKKSNLEKLNLSKDTIDILVENGYHQIKDLISAGEEKISRISELKGKKLREVKSSLIKYIEAHE